LAEIAAIGEHGQDVALHRIGELRLRAGEWTEVAKALGPRADVGQHVEDVALGYAFQQGGFQRLGRCRWLPAQAAFDHRFAFVVDDDVAARRQRSIHALGGRRQHFLQVLDEARGRGWQFDRLAVVRDLGLTLRPWQELRAIVGIRIQAFNGDVACLEGRGERSKGADLEVTPRQSQPLVGPHQDGAQPLL
jgi:hypothetical protein